MTPGFTFGTGGTGFGFSTPGSTASSTPPGTAAPAPTGGFSFGLASTPAASATSTTTTPSAGGIKFPSFAPAAQTAASTPAALSAAPSLGFNFNTGPAATATSSTVMTSSAPLFNFSSSSTSANLGSGSGSLNFGKPLVAAVNPSVTSNIQATNISSASTVLGSTANPAPAFGSGTSAALSTATTTTTFGASGAGGGANLSMRQLEEKLNKWLVELKEQEERFIRQAAHVNAWDQILQKGHNEVHALKDTLHTVKSDQSRLEAEIDFIRGQQEELERLLEPLETATNANPATQMHQGDRQRDNMYYLAQSLDAQLRRMTDDLGKVIEHLNTNSGSWQPNDPVTQVTRILSAHMDTLKWVDQKTAVLNQKVEDVARIAANAGKRI